MREKKDTRVFFALWPDDGLREYLNQAATTIPVERPARRVPRHNLHLTLHFIGNVYFDQLDCLREKARLVEADSFEFNIDRQGIFSKPRVAWLGCGEVPATLIELHERLGQQLQICDFRPEARRYHPHVTVARKIKQLPEMKDFESIRWAVDQFALVGVQPAANGVQYRVIETYPLT